MKAGWDLKRIGDVCDLMTGGTPSKSKPEYFDGGDIRWLVSGDVNKKIITDCEGRITKLGFEDSSTKYLPVNSVMIALNGQGKTRGTVALLKVKATCNQSLVSINPKDPEKLLPEYLYANLHGRYEEIRKITGDDGNDRRGLNMPLIRNIQIPIAPAEEQKRIVAILDEAFAGIDTAIANTEKNLANARELFESSLNSVFTKRGDGWEEKKLGDPDLMQIVDGDRGKNYPKKSDFLDSGYCLFLNTKNVRPDGFNFDTLMFVTEEKDKALRKGKLQRRDVLMTTRGTIGNIAIYDDSVEFENIRINSGMLIFRPNENVVLSEYLFEMLRSSIIKSQITKFVSGAAQPQLPIKTLVNFTIPVPTDLEQQKKIIENLGNLYSTTQQLESIYKQKLNSLNELKQSLLQKAFSGQLTAEGDKLMDEAVA